MINPVTYTCLLWFGYVILIAGFILTIYPFIQWMIWYHWVIVSLPLHHRKNNDTNTVKHCPTTAEKSDEKRTVCNPILYVCLFLTYLIYCFEIYVVHGIIAPNWIQKDWVAAYNPLCDTQAHGCDTILYDGGATADNIQIYIFCS